MFPAASVAVHVTVVVPTGNAEPEAGEQVGPEVTPTSSVAVTLTGFQLIVPLEPRDPNVMSAGTLTIGAVVSAGGV